MATILLYLLIFMMVVSTAVALLACIGAMKGSQKRQFIEDGYIIEQKVVEKEDESQQPTLKPSHVTKKRYA